MSERNCMKCRVCCFKEDLCEESFCEKYWGEGNSEDFINAVKQPDWIPCSERLPEENVEVLCCFVDGNKNKMIVSKRTDFNYWRGVGRTGDSVYWMPLPEPYREG